MPDRTITDIAAWLAVGLLVLDIGLQLALVLGLPVGRAAWGGEYRVLPRRLRYASLAVTGLLGLACWAVLARAGLVSPGRQSPFSVVTVWVFGLYFGLNAIANVVSESPVERTIMTPAAAILAVCFFVVACA